MTSHQHLRLRALSLSLIVAALACHSNLVAPKPTPDDVGTYTLSHVNGTAVPFAFTRNNSLVSGRQVLNADKTYSLSLVFADSLGNKRVETQSGTYSIVNTELFLSPPGVVTRIAVGDGIIAGTIEHKYTVKFVR